MLEEKFMNYLLYPEVKINEKILYHIYTDDKDFINEKKFHSGVIRFPLIEETKELLFPVIDRRKAEIA